MKSNRSFIIIFASLFLLTFFSCVRGERQNVTWQKYRYKDYDGFLYISNSNDILTVNIVAVFAGIEAQIKMTHECTREQFENIKEKLLEYDAEYVGEVDKVDTKNYPDLSGYISLVLSYDDIHAIWQEFGLEEKYED